MIISDRIAQISASPTLAMAAKAASMKAAGENILSMLLGEAEICAILSEIIILMLIYRPMLADCTILPQWLLFRHVQATH